MRASNEVDDEPASEEVLASCHIDGAVAFVAVLRRFSSLRSMLSLSFSCITPPYLQFVERRHVLEDVHNNCDR